MARWRYTIDIADLHERHQRDPIDVYDLAAGVAERIRKSRAFRDDD